MALGIRRRAGTDYAIAAVGIVDADEATEDLPVGSAAWAIVRPDGQVHVERRYIPAADRDIIQTRGAAFALESLRRQLVFQRDAKAPLSAVTP
jgi:nicotinamide-nucleotide amidase